MEMLERRGMMGNRGGGYVQDGLVFHIDVDSYDGKFLTDKIGGVVYERIGGEIPIQDNAMIFNGDAYLISQQNINFNVDECTIEIVCEYEKSAQVYVFPFWLTKTINTSVALGYYTESIRGDYNAFGWTYKSWQLNGDRQGCISLNNSRTFYNGEFATPSGGGFSLNGDVTTNNIIGARSANLARCIVGKLCCIRIYNRKLTNEETIANYIVDKARFPNIVS